MEIENNLEALEYILEHADYYIDQLIDNVMEDSEIDPEYSAVTANNLIICFLRLQKMLDDSFPINTVKEYILFTPYHTMRDYEKFERKRKKESAYYIGKQFLEQ